MAEASIPVDLFNPGQVFACLGLAEAADVLLGDIEGGFSWSDARQSRFHLRALGEGSPIERVLAFLDRAQARAAAPDQSVSSEAWIDSWGPSPVTVDRARGYPFPDPPSPATLVCTLSDGFYTIVLEHWGDATERDNVKFWAGARGYPGASLARDALALVQGRALGMSADPFSFAAPQSSSFRFDWRRDYIPVDTGFSLNAHSNMQTLGFPLVELLAAIGLTNARPRRPSARDKLVYEYAVIGTNVDDVAWLPLPLLRAALGGESFSFPTRRFRMLLDWPGQENQARAITTVTEETPA